MVLLGRVVWFGEKVRKSGANNSASIEVPLDVELFDNHFVFSKNWPETRNDMAQALGLDKILNRKVSEKEFKRIGERLHSIGKDIKPGTDWYGEKEPCVFFVNVKYRTEKNKTVRLLEKYFYKIII